jgi:glyoxylase-like metal-dependent hydrolase (beta-lactamase superfamily II)
MQSLSKNLFVFRDTCNVYILKESRSAVLIDFGSGDVLAQLPALGIEHVHAVLMTHHHRDQGQGLARAVDAGIPVYVPHTEAELFRNVDVHWQARNVDDNYNVRQDRFSILEPIPITGTLEDYGSYPFGSLTFEIIPTPGHTTGSISITVKLDGQRLAFTGDLIAAPGKVWSMAATQWTYNGVEGVAAGILSLLDMQERQPDMLLPSHGEPMREPHAAIDLLVERFKALLGLRGTQLGMLDRRARPYEPITPHLLRHTQSVANSYVLLSERGTAMIIDFGYEFETGLPDGTDRASRRPWLYSLPVLKREFGVSRIDVALPTHYHDDHVAGINLLRRVEGAQVWAAEPFADILEQPKRYDLPCLWYEPIPVNRRLPLETSFQWEEYTFTLYPLPGHTRYAVAIAVEVDGKRVLISGDQYQGFDTPDPNYVYANRFEADDFARSAALYRELQPDLILTGHWMPLWTTTEYFDRLDTVGAKVEELHYNLLLDGATNDDVIARLLPYQAEVAPGESIQFQIEVTNPFAQPAEAKLTLVLPSGWQQPNDLPAFTIAPRATHTVAVTLPAPPNFNARRARLAVDVTLNDTRYGQQAEALITSAVR